VHFGAQYSDGVYVASSSQKAGTLFAKRLPVVRQSSVI